MSKYNNENRHFNIAVLTYGLIIFGVSFFFLYIDIVSVNKGIIYLFILENIFLIIAVVFYKYIGKKHKIIEAILLGWGTICNDIFVVEALVNGNCLFLGLPKYFYNFMLFSAIIIVLYLVTNSFKVSIVLNNFLWLTLAISNHIITVFRGRPIFCSDIFAIKTAIDVADSYTFNISGFFIVICGFALFATCFELYLIRALNLKPFIFSRAKRVILITISASILLIICSTKVLSIFGITPSFWNHTANGYAANMVIDIKCQLNKRIENYDVNEIRKLANEYTEEEKPSVQEETLPDIVVVMNESYCDFTMLEKKYTTNVDVSPYVNSLSDNIIKGNLYVSVFGGSTANSEYEFLTGDSMLVYPAGEIPYQTTYNNRKNINSIVKRMNDLGYKTIAMHPYTASNWNRPSVYKAMGFDEIVFIEDYNNIEYLRGVITDNANYLEIIEQLQNNYDEPVFIFNISMQNHGGYSAVTKDFDQGVDLNENFPIAEGYLNLIKLTDKANSMLINYLENRKKNTVFLMFGDHQPAIENEFIEMLISPENDKALTKQEISQKYITNFFIWANYDIKERVIDKMSINYLHTLLFDVADLPKTKYMKYLSELYKEYPVVTSVSIYDNEGNYYYPLSESVVLSRIEEYKRIVYNHSIDRKNSVDSFYN